MSRPAQTKRIRHLFTSTLVVCVFSTAGLMAQEKKTGPGTAKITYDDHIKPIFRAKCFSCHNTDKKISGLDLTNYTSMVLGGSSGEVIERGDSSSSYLYLLVTHDSEPFMPPKSEKMETATLDLIRNWIDGGALENAGSKPIITKKKFDFGLSTAPAGKPQGPPPMPGRLTLEPVVRTLRKSAVTALATNPWAPLIAVAGQKQVLLYHAKSLELIGVLPFPEGVPYVLKFSRNGSLLLAAGGRGAYQGKAVLWNVKTGERITEVGDELDAVLAADISADHTMVALGGTDRKVRIYSTATGELLNTINKHTDWIYSVEFSPDGVLLATGDRNGGLFVWEAFTAREYLSLRGHSKGITGLSWRIDSNLLASCSEDGAIRLWEMENGRNVKNWRAHGGGTSAVEFTRDGRLVSCGRDRVTKIWDQTGKQLRAFPAFSDIALRVTHCDETNRVVAGDWTGAIRVWNAADGKQVGELNSNPLAVAQRLEASAKQLPAAQVNQKKLTATYQAAKAAADKTTANLAAANKTVADSQKRIQTGTAAVTKVKQAVAQLTTEQQNAMKAVAALEPVAKQLQNALTKAQQAAEKAKDDKKLAEAATKAKVEFDKKNVELAAARKTLAAKTTALATTKQQLAASVKQVKDAQTALTAAKKQVAAITPSIKPTANKAAAAKTALNAAAMSVKGVQLAIARWRDEIEFGKKLKVVAEHRVKYVALANVETLAKQELDKIKVELTTINQTIANSQKQSQAAATVVATAKQNVAKLTAEKNAAGKSVAALGQVLPLLTESFTKGQQAATKTPADVDVKNVVAQLKTVIDKKTAALAATKKTLAEKTTTLAQATAAQTAAEKKVVDLAAMVAAAKKHIGELTAAAKPAQAKFDAAAKEASAAKAVLDKMKTDLSAPRKVEQATAQAAK